MSEITRLLEATQPGEPQAAVDLLPAVYNELRKLAAAKLAHEKPGQMLNATALVHEAFLRLEGDQKFACRTHFFSAAAEAMRRILIEQARRRSALKRGGNSARDKIELDQIAVPSIDDDIIALDDALKLLAVEYPEHADLVKLRYFAGLTADESASMLEISPSTADRRWTFARAWLKRAMT